MKPMLVLAVDTNEAHAVVLCDGWVRKILRSLPKFAPPEWGLWPDQLSARVAASAPPDGLARRVLAPGVEINPLYLVESARGLVLESPLVRGRVCHPEKVAQLREQFAHSHPWLLDLLVSNIATQPDGTHVFLDFAVDLAKWKLTAETQRRGEKK